MIIKLEEKKGAGFYINLANVNSIEISDSGYIIFSYKEEDLESQLTPQCAKNVKEWLDKNTIDLTEED